MDVSFIKTHPAQASIAYYQPDPDYRKTEGLSQSAMKELLISPAHYMAAYGPNAEPRFPSAAMIWGSAFHCKVLEPEVFENLYFDRSSKPKEPTVQELKDMLDKAQVEYPKSAKKAELEKLLWPEGKKKDNRTSMDPRDFEGVSRAAEALRSHDITGDWFCPGQENYRRDNEVSVYVVEQVTGLILKGRFDRLVVDDDKKTVKILDLKTTQDATYNGFQRSVANFSYDLQSSWYSELAKKCYPGYEVEFFFIAIEKRAPYGISVFRASDQLLLSGAKKMSNALNLYQQAHALDYFPAYDPIVLDMTLPSWASRAKNDPSEF